MTRTALARLLAGLVLTGASLAVAAGPPAVADATTPRAGRAHAVATRAVPAVTSDAANTDEVVVAAARDGLDTRPHASRTSVVTLAALVAFAALAAAHRSRVSARETWAATTRIPVRRRGPPLLHTG